MSTSPKHRTLASNWLKTATQTLNEADDPTSRLDCLVLLEDSLDKPRAHILAHEEIELTNRQLIRLNSQVQLRRQHVPLAYIRGRSEFYGRQFLVNNHTLAPRPDSETMIDLAKRLFINDVPKKVADIGCGSGCLGITLSLELPGIELDMYDIDKFCVATSKQNADILSVNANYYLNDLLKGSEIEYNLILANLPYVPNSHTVNKDAMSEPKHAIFGGPDGLSLYRRLFKQLGNSTLPRHVLTESLPAQHENLSKIARKFGYDLIEIDDFIQCFKKL